MQRDEIAAIIHESSARFARGLHEEVVGLAAQVVSPLREEIDRGGEGVQDARRLLASALHLGGMSLYELHDLHSARQCFQDALQLASESGNMRGVASALHETARIAVDWGHLEQAVELCKRAIRATILAGGEAIVAMQTLAMVQQLMGHGEEADIVLRYVRESCEARGDLMGLGQALHEMGLSAAAQHRSGDAIGCFVKAMRVERVSADAAGMARSRLALEDCIRRSPEAADHPLLTRAMESM